MTVAKATYFRLNAQKIREKLNARSCAVIQGQTAMRKFLIPASLIFSLFALTAPVAAKERPESCVLIATIQDDHCAVTNHFSCTGSGPIAFWQEISHGSGAVEIHSLDANYGLIELVMPGGPSIKSRSTGEHPRAAIQAGSSRSKEQASVESGGSIQPAAMVTNYSHAGETRKLAGEVFYRLAYSSDLFFPESGSKLHTFGSYLFSERLNLMILEVDVSDGEGGPARKIKLKTLALEGQKGFGSTRPKYGCR